jgi:membrane-associated protease RseP (regulator of RpoE activity)
MGRCLLALAFLAALAWPCAQAQTSPRTGRDKVKNEPQSNPDQKQTLQGFYCRPVPEPLVAHLCNYTLTLQKGTGLLVDRVQADSAAAQLGLKRFDILLSYKGQAIKGADQLAGLVQAARGDPRAALVLIRGGKEMTLKVDLARTLEPVTNQTYRDSRGNVKNGGPPEVTVTATAIGGGKMEVTFEYLQGGKSRKTTYTGNLDEIEKQVKNLPMPAQDFARVAVKRLRNQRSR